MDGPNMGQTSNHSVKEMNVYKMNGDDDEP